LKVAIGDLIAPVFLAFVLSGFFGLVYNVTRKAAGQFLQR
jgi:hypothetical protein